MPQDNSILCQKTFNYFLKAGMFEKRTKRKNSRKTQKNNQGKAIKIEKKLHNAQFFQL